MVTAEGERRLVTRDGSRFKQIPAEEDDEEEEEEIFDPETEISPTSSEVEEVAEEGNSTGEPAPTREPAPGAADVPTRRVARERRRPAWLGDYEC